MTCVLQFGDPDRLEVEIRYVDCKHGAADSDHGAGRESAATGFLNHPLLDVGAMYVFAAFCLGWVLSVIPNMQP